jgi:hypothetical protein
MNEQFKQPVSGFEVGRLPEDVLTMARTTVEGAREVFSTASEVASKGTERWQHVALSNYGAAQQIADKCLENVTSNLDAAFDAARAMAGSKTIPEASAVYRDFLNERFATTVAQTKELCTLSSNLFQRSLEEAAASAAASDRQEPQ